MMPIWCAGCWALLVFAFLVPDNMAQTKDPKTNDPINYDEAKVRPYVLPDALLLADGAKVDTPELWRTRRRAELLALFASQQYGQRPPMPEGLRHEVLDVNESFAGGKATRKRVRVDFFGQGRTGPGFTITLIVPNDAKGPVPAFVGMHLFESASEAPVPGKLLDVPVDEPLPGNQLLATILNRGYAIATLDAAEFCADDKKTFREGFLAHLDQRGWKAPDNEQPGAIAVWAWALSRALDYFETDRQIDARRVIVIGHSRMGKTALWAGAQDERFAMVVSNNSGCAGAALSRRDFGETVARIGHAFPHWFCANFSAYAGHEEQMPVDQHELLALSAPRPLYVASAQEDAWADPQGEFLAAVGADPVYTLLGKVGLGTHERPAIGKSIGTMLGYHCRVGKHALTDYDWLRYLDFADRQLAAR